MVGGVGNSTYDFTAPFQMRQNLLANLDSNGDGAIDKNEMTLARTTVEMSITDVFNELDSKSGGIISTEDLSSGVRAAQSILSFSSNGGADAGMSQTNGIFDTIMKAYSSRIVTGSEGSNPQYSGLISLLA